MATFYSGQNGRMEIDGVRAAKVVNWGLNVTQSTLPTTTIGDTDATFISGVRNATGKCRLYYYDRVNASGANENSCSTLIKTLIKKRTDANEPGVAAAPDQVTFKLQVIEGATTKLIEVDAVLTSAVMNMGVGEVLAADVAFKVNGAVKDITL